MEFDARAVAFLPDGDLEAEVVVLAEQEDGSGRRVELQRPLVVTDDDRRLGMDTYCLVAETGATHYGGIESATFEDEVLELRLSPDAAHDLGVESGFRIRLADPARTAQVVKDGLRAILQ